MWMKEKESRKNKLETGEIRCAIYGAKLAITQWLVHKVSYWVEETQWFVTLKSYFPL